MRRIHDISRGVPRRINLLCDRALLGAYALSRGSVDRRIVDRAALEVFGRQSIAAPVRQRTALVLGLGLAAGAGLYAAATRVGQHEVDAPRVAMKAAATTVTASAPGSAASTASTPSAASATAKPAQLMHEPQEAWRELAAMWKVQLTDGDACAQLAKQQIECFTRNLNLGLIRELGRPGIVTLDALQGTPLYALLTGVTRDTATLRAAGVEQTVTLAALAARWNGEFATLWRAPPGYAPRGEPRAETAAWMALHLDPGSTGASAPLKTRLRNFQLAQGLPADGQPGPMTYMQLNRASSIDEPRLRMQP